MVFSLNHASSLPQVSDGMTAHLNAASCNSQRAYRESPNTLEGTKVTKSNTEGPFPG